MRSPEQEWEALASVPVHMAEQLMNIVDQEWGLLHAARARGAPTPSLPDPGETPESFAGIFYYAYGSLRNIYDSYFRAELMSQEDRRSRDPNPDPNPNPNSHGRAAKVMTSRPKLWRESRSD